MKTQTQRDAINARAAAWPRPISPLQRDALQKMLAAALYRCDQGKAFGDTNSSRTWPMQTIRSLEGRGLCFIHEGRFARITAAGKRELARHRP